jgi:hypothetical protein
MVEFLFRDGRVKKLANAYNRTRLTPFIKKVFTRRLKWQGR